MKKIITIFLTPVFVLIMFLKRIFDLIYPVSSGMAETLNDLFCDMYEFWKKVFKWDELTDEVNKFKNKE